MAIKRKLIIGFAVFSVITLGACSDGVESDAKKPSVFTGGEANYHSVVIDKETGCHYIETYVSSYSDMATLIPRLNSEGKPMCGKGPK